MQALRPLFALFVRSLREDTRARLPTILRVALVVLILLILWSNQRSFVNHTAPGREFFLMVMMLNLGFIAVAALSIFSSAIAEEKEDETLTLLRMTNLSALAILFGKSTSRLLSALLLLAVQIPFTLLAITLGGISLDQVWGAYAILGATTFFLCNLALLASVYSRTTLRAGFFTGFLGVILYAVLPVIGIVTSLRAMGPMAIGTGTGTFAQQAWSWIIQANPVWALVMLLANPVGGTLSMSHIWINLVGGLVCFGLSWLLFDRFCKQLPEVIARVRKTRNGKVRRWGWVGRSWKRLPIAWKDFHFMIGGLPGFFFRVAFGAAIFGIVWWIFSKSENPFRQTDWREEICATVLGCAAFCAGLELLLLCGRIFGSERQRQTLSSLVGLPWPTGKIIRQKILGCLPVFLPWILLALAAVVFGWEAVTDEFSREYRQWEMRNDSNGEWREIWEAYREEISAMCYVTLQALLLLVTISWFSLRIRRGALPASIAVLAVWNVIFALCIDEMHSRDEYIGLFVGVALTFPVLILMGRAVYLRIQTAAAED